MKNKVPDISIYPTKTLEQLADVVAGAYVPSKQRLKEGVWQLIRGRNIIEGSVSNSEVFVPEEMVKKHSKAITIPGDILISTLFKRYKIGIVPSKLGPAIIDRGIVRIRSKKIQQKYLVAYFNTKLGKTAVSEQLITATRGSVIKFVTVSDIRSIEIPLLPEDILEEFEERDLWKSPLKDLAKIRVRYEQELMKTIKLVLLKKGWRKSDIAMEYKLTGSLMADVVLKKQDQPFAIIEIKKDARNLKSISQQVQMMCQLAQVKYGYLVTENGIFEIEGRSGEMKEVTDLPASEEGK